MKLSTPLIVLLLMALASCASVRAPGMDGTTWIGQDGSRLNAQLRYPAGELPEGWLLKVEKNDAVGSFAYRKKSGTYSYSEDGYFAIDPQWRSDPTYIGLLKAGGVFCVVNPEMQADVAGSRITTYKVYDYCVQLRSQ